MDFKRENNVFKIKYRLDIEQAIDNCNTDVFIKIIDTDQIYVATFYTYKNIDSIIKKNQESGEYLAGAYFWGTDMILIKNLRAETIDEVVFEILKEEDFNSIFNLVESDSKELVNW